jgi:N-acyl amino acid synthase of PEP-CTERM/exosortase system
MFDFIRIGPDDPRIDDIYRLRYKVYIEEWGFERPEDHPKGIECDAFDEYSSHYAAIRQDDGLLIGTVRVIRYSESGFPILHHSAIDRDMSGFDLLKAGEISRLAICKEFRQRVSDKIMFEGHDVSRLREDPALVERRRIDRDIVLGLYRCVYQECMEEGLTHILAVMANGLQFLLKRAGLVFEPIGPEVDYHGKRTPYIGDVRTMLSQIAAWNPELYRCFLQVSRGVRIDQPHSAIG